MCVVCCANQPAMSAVPPMGATAPKRFSPVSAYAYRLPLNSRMPADNSRVEWACEAPERSGVTVSSREWAKWY